MGNRILVGTLADLPNASKLLINAFPEERLFAFKGSMGAGKTTFIKEICKYLGVVDEVTSPTFAIINEYFTLEDQSVFHFDFYRIKKMVEVMDIGYEEYIYSGNYCLMEWPEKIEELLPENIVYVQIEEDPDNGSRIITYKQGI